MFLVVNFLSAVFAAFVIAGAFLLIKKSLGGFWRAPRAVFARAPGVAFLAIVFTVPLLTGLVSGKSFHSRYCLVLLAPLLTLAAAATVRWLAGPRPNRVFLAVVVITTAANIWFVPASDRLQERRIEQVRSSCPVSASSRRFIKASERTPENPN